jgi:ferredoxin-NADP reductase
MRLAKFDQLAGTWPPPYLAREERKPTDYREVQARGQAILDANRKSVLIYCAVNADWAAKANELDVSVQQIKRFLRNHWEYDKYKARLAAFQRQAEPMRLQRMREARLCKKHN